MPDHASTKLLTRRDTLALGAKAALLGGLGGSIGSLAHAVADAAPSASGDIGRYLEFMDMVCARLEERWSKVRGAYWPTVGGYSTLVNARMLQIHANAAAVGHEGPSRNDQRALSLVSVLLAGPAPWRTEANSVTRKDKMFHLPGWTESLNDPNANMDKAVDPQVAEALTAAWRIADVLGMDGATAQQLIAQVSACARGKFFRYPGIRLNQLNWNSALYALDAELTGNPELLRDDYRKQLIRFTTYATRPELDEGTPNLGPGWHFSYLPNWPPTASYNLDAAEYANETIDAVRHYPQALAAGMTPLPSWSMGVLRSWAWRVLYGYWTHAGYLNWDTGLGAKRRYIGKVFALAQQGLLAIATTPTFQLNQTMAAHARWFFDRSLDLYQRWSEEDPSGLAPPVQFGDREHSQSEESQVLFAARIASNAAQAIHLGLADIPSHQPPSLWSFDPDSQRLAVSTPGYSTAIVVHNHKAVPYGGIDLCRLFDSQQRPVGSTAGEGIANFSSRVRDSGGEVLIDTHMGESADMSVSARYPGAGVRRVGSGSAPYPTLPYAGPMSSVRATGRVAAASAAIETEHELEPSSIQLRWKMSLPKDGSWEVSLPSYGKQAQILLTRPSGTLELTEGQQPVDLSGVRQIAIKAQAGAYLVDTVGSPPSARLRVERVPPGSGASTPGPSLIIEGHRHPAGGLVELALRLRTS